MERPLWVILPLPEHHLTCVASIRVLVSPVNALCTHSRIPPQQRKKTARNRWFIRLLWIPPCLEWAKSQKDRTLDLKKRKLALWRKKKSKLQIGWFGCFLPSSDMMAGADLAVQVMQTTYNVSCTVYVENDTNFKLINPTTNIHNGSIKVRKFVREIFTRVLNSFQQIAV